MILCRNPSHSRPLVPLGLYHQVHWMVYLFINTTLLETAKLLLLTTSRGQRREATRDVIRKTITGPAERSSTVLYKQPHFQMVWPTADTVTSSSHPHPTIQPAPLRKTLNSSISIDISVTKTKLYDLKKNK